MSKGAGWYDDPKRPGMQRYWVDGNWDDLIAPRQKPEPVWKRAQPIALGALVALIAFWTLLRLTT